MKFLDIFSGIGGFRIGMEMAGHECVGHIEWDKFAQKSYMAMHDVKESEFIGWDIRKIRSDELPQADVWCFGFPCQDISIAGKQEGFAGHRSSLFFAVTRLIRDIKEENRPSILFIENVKNLLSVNRGGDFLKLLIELDEIGYDAEWQLLNSKDFGVPQNRERVFIIGHLRGRGTRKVFPISGQGNQNTTVSQSAETAISRTLTAGGHSGGNHSGMTILCDTGQGRKWQERESLTPPLRAQGGGNSPGICVKQIGNCMPTKTRDNPNQGRIYDPQGISPCLNKMEGGGREPMIAIPDRRGVKIKEATKRGYTIAEEGDSINLERPNSKTRRGRVGKGVAQTLTTSCNQATIVPNWNMDKFAEMMTSPPDPSKQLKDYADKNNFRIRRLTPRECFRLQGVADEYFNRAASINSDSQLYKQAGNMVTVNVIYEIAKRLGND